MGSQWSVSYLISPINVQNDSSSCQATWWTTTRSFPFCLRHQRTNGRYPRSTKHNLSPVNGQRLRTFGRRRVSFTFLGRPCSHEMTVADVVNLILGMGYFQDGEGKRFLVSPLKGCLTDRFTLEESGVILYLFVDSLPGCAQGQLVVHYRWC